MAGLIEAIDVKRKMFIELDDTPFHALDVEVSRPTARGGQTLVRLQMRNLRTRAVFDRTFKAAEKVRDAALVKVPVSFEDADAAGLHFMDLERFATPPLSPETVGDDRLLLADAAELHLQKYNGNPIGLMLPPHVELTVVYTEP